MNFPENMIVPEPQPTFAAGPPNISIQTQAAFAETGSLPGVLALLTRSLVRLRVFQKFSFQFVR